MPPGPAGPDARSPLAGGRRRLWRHRRDRAAGRGRDGHAARHRSLACPHGTAAAALLCELVEGRDLLDAARVGQPDLDARAGAARGQPGVRRGRRRCAACGDRRGARGRTAAAGGRPDCRRDERRRRLGGRAAEGRRGRPGAGRRHAAAVDRPRRAGLRARLLLAGVRPGARDRPATRWACRTSPSTCARGSAGRWSRSSSAPTGAASRRTRACAATARSASMR